MRRVRRNSDRRLRDLQRALNDDPTNVELQHQLVHALARVGELPQEAVERLIEGRPAQPWQFVPASYVLLEAQRRGLESNWNEGRVEAEWTRPLTDPTPRRQPRAGRDMAPHRFYVSVGRFSLFDCEGLGGVPVHERTTRGSPPPPLERLLRYLPPRWVPGLTYQEGCAYALREEGVLSRRSWSQVPVFFADDLAASGVTLENRYDCASPRLPGDLRPTSSYSGPFPDAYTDQWLLRVGQRIRTDGAGRRYLGFGGPPIDVRAIKRIRIMEKRGKAWRN